MRPIIHFNQLPPRHAGPVAIDLEIFQADRRQLHRPRGFLACASFCTDGRNVYIITREDQLQRALDRVHNGLWIMHNANFDLRHIRRWATVAPRDADHLWDTQIIERLLWSGWYDQFDLGSLSRRYLDVLLNKTTREQFYKGDTLSNEMIRYAAEDACATFRVQAKQRVLVNKRPSVWSVWSKIDLPALWAVLDFKGFRVNRKAWKALADGADAEMQEIAGRLGFNPNSPPQVKAALAKENIELESTEEKFLLPYKDNSVVGEILAYRGASKNRGTYGYNILEMLEDGYLWPNHEPVEAVTGRMTSDGPNIQNIPREHRYRVCFLASPDGSIVGGDYVQQEPWLAVVQNEDPALWQAFENGEDTHLTVGRAIFDDPKMTKKDERRQIGKRIHLGLLYGLTAYGLAEQTGLPFEQCDMLVQNFFQRFRGVDRWIRAKRKEAASSWKTQTLGGREMHLNLYGKQWPNHAINTPVQGSAADVTKMALANLHSVYGSDLPVVAVVHDEFVMDVKHGKVREARAALSKAMNDAIWQIVKEGPKHTHVETYVGKNWADKK